MDIQISKYNFPFPMYRWNNRNLC